MHLKVNIKLGKIFQRALKVFFIMALKEFLNSIGDYLKDIERFGVIRLKNFFFKISNFILPPG